MSMRKPVLIDIFIILLFCNSLSAQESNSTVRPMAKLYPDISFILDSGFGWFSQHEHIRQGGAQDGKTWQKPKI